MICNSLAIPFAIVGILSGLHIATLEAYKTVPSLKKFLRTLFIGIILLLSKSYLLQKIVPLSYLR